MFPISIFCISNFVLFYEVYTKLKSVKQGKWKDLNVSLAQMNKNKNRSNSWVYVYLRTLNKCTRKELLSLSNKWHIKGVERQNKNKICSSIIDLLVTNVSELGNVSTEDYGSVTSTKKNKKIKYASYAPTFCPIHSETSSDESTSSTKNGLTRKSNQNRTLKSVVTMESEEESDISFKNTTSFKTPPSNPYKKAKVHIVPESAAKNRQNSIQDLNSEISKNVSCTNALEMYLANQRKIGAGTSGKKLKVVIGRTKCFSSGRSGVHKFVVVLDIIEMKRNVILWCYNGDYMVEVLKIFALESHNAIYSTMATALFRCDYNKYNNVMTTMTGYPMKGVCLGYTYKGIQRDAENHFQSIVSDLKSLLTNGDFYKKFKCGVDGFFMAKNDGSDGSTFKSIMEAKYNKKQDFFWLQNSKDYEIETQTNIKLSDYFRKEDIFTRIYSGIFKNEIDPRECNETFGVKD